MNLLYTVSGSEDDRRTAAEEGGATPVPALAGPQHGDVPRQLVLPGHVSPHHVGSEGGPGASLPPAPGGVDQPATCHINTTHRTVTTTSPSSIRLLNHHNVPVLVIIIGLLL